MNALNSQDTSHLSVPEKFKAVPEKSLVATRLLVISVLLLLAVIAMIYVIVPVLPS